MSLPSQNERAAYLLAYLAESKAQLVMAHTVVTEMLPVPERKVAIMIIAKRTIGIIAELNTLMDIARTLLKEDA